MELSNQIVIEKPAEEIFAQIVDLDLIVDQLPSNVTLRAASGDTEFIEGSTWTLRAKRAGRNFVLETEITERNDPKLISFHSESNRLSIDTTIIVEPKTAASCELSYTSKLAAKGLLGRILLQSVRASQSRIDRRMEDMSQKAKAYFEAT